MRELMLSQQRNLFRPVFAWAHRMSSSTSADATDSVPEKQEKKHDKLYKRIDLEMRAHNPDLLRSYITFVKVFLHYLIKINKFSLECLQPIGDWEIALCAIVSLQEMAYLGVQIEIRQEEIQTPLWDQNPHPTVPRELPDGEHGQHFLGIHREEHPRGPCTESVSQYNLEKLISLTIFQHLHGNVPIAWNHNGPRRDHKFKPVLISSNFYIYLYIKNTKQIKVYFSLCKSTRVKQQCLSSNMRGKKVGMIKAQRIAGFRKSVRILFHKNLSDDGKQ